MTVDNEGMLWVALGRAGAVHRYHPDGTRDGIVELPTTNPTSVAFGGSDGGDLYITTSWLDCEERHRGAQPLAGTIFRRRPGVTGRPSPRWAGAAPPPHQDLEPTATA
jgi:sugar lactone lactonase YvrE